VEEEESLLSGDDSQDGEQLFLMLSLAAASGSPSPRTMCLQRLIQGHAMQILVDSGSSHTFISEGLASKLYGISAVSTPITVQVANGHRIKCTSIFTAA
jgi:hypothetical protein